MSEMGTRASAASIARRGKRGHGGGRGTPKLVRMVAFAPGKKPARDAMPIRQRETRGTARDWMWKRRANDGKEVTRVESTERKKENYAMLLQLILTHMQAVDGMLFTASNSPR